jgi:hypothetical protein
MKRNIKVKKQVSLVIILLAALLSGSIFQACEKSDTPSAIPVVNYIRITNPDKSDSLVVSAYMGQLIVLMGENMQDVNQIWFNDQPASVNTNLVTSTNIIVTVPNVIPGVVTNQIRLITADHRDTLKVPFNVKVPAPQLDAMVCEYVPTGGTAIIKGNYFINDPSAPLQVFFPGNIEGSVTSVAIDEIKVTVPSGVGVGPLQVKSIYGSTRSTFYFRDDRNIMLDFDTKTAAGGWRSGVIKSSDPDPISGNFVKFSGTMAGKAGATWNEDAFSFDLWPSSNGRPNVPVYTGNIADGVIKFECYVVDSWQASALQMIFTPYSTANTNSYIADSKVPRGLWKPWTKTEGYKTSGWITVSVPLSDFKFAPDGSNCSTAFSADMISGLTFFVWNGGVDGVDCTPTLCIDNIRVVNK